MATRIRYNSLSLNRWITRLELARPFIRLPYSFDAETLAAEAAQIPASAWMEHPQRMNGNSAAALISRDGGDNDDFAGEMLETPHLKACPYLRQTLGSFGEVLGRSRLMKLAAGAEVATHVDFNYHWYSRVRIHIPVITNADVTFYCADQMINMAAGEAWIFNSWRRHKVTNESSVDRIHLVVDVAGSSRFWGMVREMQQFDLAVDSDKIDALVRQVPYEPETSVEIRTEKYNISPVMAPGEVDAIVNALIADFAHNSKNDAAIVNDYISLLFDFSKDWREIWQLHGLQEDGWASYQTAIDKALGRMSADPRAVVTQSNDIGVRPVIVQRLLRAALATDRMQHFVGQDDGKS